jgi:nucleoside-diphosphate-sugar epimerase
LKFKFETARHYACATTVFTRFNDWTYVGFNDNDRNDLATQFGERENESRDLGPLSKPRFQWNGEKCVMNDLEQSSAPELIGTEDQLDHVLTQPRRVLIDSMRQFSSPLVVLGAGGKMGPSLAVLARRAAEAAQHGLKVIAVSRFSDAASRDWLEARGVDTISADLLNRAAVERLPDSANVVYLVGLKFGTAQNPSLTWAANTLVPAAIAERYSKARVVALSTGNVYPLVPVASGGAVETHPLTPLGEYANAAVARERIFEYLAARDGTRVVLLRLNYALELRYGVLVDLARKVMAEQPIDLTTGYCNVIWQGDANEMILRALAFAATPPNVFNLTSPEMFSVQEIALELARLLQRPATFTGAAAGTALLSNSSRLCALLGVPATPLQTVVRWTAHWVKNNGRFLGKPTRFEVRDGRY